MGLAMCKVVIYSPSAERTIYSKSSSLLVLIIILLLYQFECLIYDSWQSWINIRSPLSIKIYFIALSVSFFLKEGAKAYPHDVLRDQ